MAKPPEEKRVPLGKGLGWTEEDIDRLAEITPQDIEEAKAAWRRDAPPWARELLDATEEAEPDE